jgi:hypothetical protein
MKTLKDKLNSFWFGALLIIIIAGIAYLPLVSQLGYLNDDWYLMYDMQVKDPSFFHEIFGIDRPGRALAMIPLFSLFGFNPLFYHLSAFLFRAFGGVFVYWTMRMVWGERRNFFALVTGILFTIYPGFLSMPNAIDYQSHILGLFLATLSVALTVKAVVTENRTHKIFLIAASILAGWGYLSQMEYFLGIEALRFAIIIVLMWREAGETFWQKVLKIVKVSLPFLLIAAGFLVWRLFFFESERKATDVGLQVSQIFSDPLIAMWWLNYLIQDFFTVTLVAWNLPVYQLSFAMRLKDMAAGIAWSALAVAALLAGVRLGGEKIEDDESSPSTGTMRETLFISILSIAGGLIPVILVNRHVTLPDYSRYTLIASIGAVMLLALMIESISKRGTQMAVMGVLVAVAVLTHYGNTIRYVDETQATRNFWWQVAWRAPKIEEGVTLLAMYPNSPLSEDYFIWSPANFIYYPEKQSNTPVVVKLPAAVLDGNTVTQVTTNGGVETPLRRGNYLERDFGNVLVMVQSSANSCVRFLNGASPELNSFDDGRIVMVAPYSKLNAVSTDGGIPSVPENILGSEPERGWCFYYQQADLARQRSDWDAVTALLDEALDKGYYPNDPLEWIPFMQAYAVQGDVDEIREMTKLIVLDRYLRLQVCNNMKYLAENESLSAEVNEFITKKICE